MTIISKESLDKIRQERVPREDEIDLDKLFKQRDETQKEKQRDEKEDSSQIGSFHSFKPEDKYVGQV